LAQVGHEDQSSSVDLGSVHSLNVFPEEPSHPEPADVDSGIVLDESASPETAPGIDLDMAGTATRKPAPSTSDAEALDLSGMEEAGEAAEVEAEEVVEEEEAKEEKEEKPAKKEKPRGRAGAWMGGTVLGAVLGSAACLGVWVAGIEPPADLREMVGT